jgi:hypothetical protein
MTDFQSIITERINSINKNKDNLDSVRKWIEGYDGKIISLKMNNNSYHIVFTKNGINCRPGIYPNSEVHYQAKDEMMLAILEGKTSAYSEAKNGRCLIRGSLNEASAFEKIFIKNFITVKK